MKTKTAILVLAMITMFSCRKETVNIFPDQKSNTMDKVEYYTIEGQQYVLKTATRSQIQILAAPTLIEPQALVSSVEVSSPNVWVLTISNQTKPIIPVLFAQNNIQSNGGNPVLRYSFSTCMLSNNFGAGIHTSYQTRIAPYVQKINQDVTTVAPLPDPGYVAFNGQMNCNNIQNIAFRSNDFIKQDEAGSGFITFYPTWNPAQYISNYNSPPTGATPNDLQFCARIGYNLAPDAYVIVTTFSYLELQ